MRNEWEGGNAASKQDMMCGSRLERENVLAVVHLLLLLLLSWVVVVVVA